jgi:tetratricopeptide (TPR) repeat protein
MAGRRACRKSGLCARSFSGFSDGFKPQVFGVHRNPAIARVFALILTCVVGAPAGADQRGSPWTANDSDAVADAAIAATDDNKSKLTDTSTLMELVDALIRAGNIPKAKQVVEVAASYFGAAELQNSLLRGRIVENLALLGDAASAEVLAAAEIAQPAKIALFGKFGTGRAHAGHVKDAQRAATTINALSGGSATAAATDTSARALADISLALAESGALAEAFQIVRPLPDGLPKVQALSQVARLACKKAGTQTGATRHGRMALEQAIVSAGAAIAAADTLFAKVNLAVAAGEAIACCSGADAARSFIDRTFAVESRNDAAGSLVDRLTQQNEFAVARSLLSTANPTDTARLFEAAKRFMKLGDRAKATEVAVKAMHAVPDNSGPRPGAYYRTPPNPGQIASLLIDLGAYDEAIAAATAAKINNRSYYYFYAVNVAARNADVASVARLLPVAFDALKMDSNPDRGAQFRSLFDLTKVLALAGYRDQALRTFGELQGLLTKAQVNALMRQDMTSLAAVLQADKGDIAGALQAADQAGTMVEKPDRLTIMMAVAMMMGNKQPTQAEIMEAVQQAEALMPLVIGPKARVLSDIAVHMAAKGDIAAASRAVAVLEEERNDLIRGARDTAVNAVANAQIKAGDLRGAFATALRIRESAVRRMPLLKLAGSPITR